MWIWIDLFFFQRSWRKCRQVEISISLGSLELVFTLYILLLTTLKSLANTQVDTFNSAADADDEEDDE